MPEQHHWRHGSLPQFSSPSSSEPSALAEAARPLKSSHDRVRGANRWQTQAHQRTHHKQTHYPGLRSIKQPQIRLFVYSFSEVLRGYERHIECGEFSPLWDFFGRERRDRLPASDKNPKAARTRRTPKRPGSSQAANMTTINYLRSYSIANSTIHFFCDSFNVWRYSTTSARSCGVSTLYRSAGMSDIGDCRSDSILLRLKVRTSASAPFSVTCLRRLADHQARDQVAVLGFQYIRFVVVGDAGAGIEDRLVERFATQLLADLGEIGADFLAGAVDEVAVGAGARGGEQGLAPGGIAAALDQLADRRQPAGCSCRPAAETGPRPGL